MSNPFDSLMNPGSIGQNAMQAFEQGQKWREEREVRGALSTYATNPEDPEAFKTLAKYKPELAIKIGEDRRKRDKDAEIQRLTGLAAQGDKPAMAQLAGIDFDKYNALSDNQRQEMKGRVDYIGNSALAISRLPPEQRAAAWEQAIQQGVQLGHNDLAQFAGKYSDQTLQAALANAGQVKAFIDMTEPKQFNVEAGGARYEQDPVTGAIKTIVAPNPGDKPAFSPVAKPAQTKQIGDKTYFQTPDGKWHDSPPEGGQTARPSGTFRGGVSGSAPVANGAAVVSQLFPNARITQNRRDPNSALGRANPKSWHNRSGGAVDVAPIKGMTFEQYVERVKAAGYNIIEARDEVKNPSSHATGPHWHIVIGEA